MLESKQTMKKIFLFASLFFYLLPFSVCAEGFADLRREAIRIKTISAGFVQKKQMKILSRPLVSEGRFFYVAPDSFRWEYIKPLRSVIISHKGETKRFILVVGKMTQDQTQGVKAMNIVLNEVVNWMSGKFESNPAFKASLKEGTNTLITLTPVGQNMAGIIEKIEISVVKKTMAIKTVKIIEGEKAATIIDFSNVEINKAVNESVFQDVQ
jgi:outer membrane lipoprotein-sorting protein